MGKAVDYTGTGFIQGKGPLAKAMGLSGAQGDFAKYNGYNPALAEIAQRNEFAAGSDTARALADYGQGNINLADAMKVGKGVDVQQDEINQLLATDAMAGSRFATDQVNSNPIMGRLYGSGQDSALSRALAEEKQLASRGFSLQPEDYEAYGQASGDITRQFGQQEQSLAQALADRGLSAGASGAAAVNFSGLAGNKNEQLAKAQMGIADMRMKKNLERLNSTRQHMNQLGNQSQNAIQDQFNRQMSGAEFKRGNLQNAANLSRQQSAQDFQGMQGQIAGQRAAKGKTLLDAAGSGLYSGVEGGTSALVGGAIGGAGGSMNAQKSSGTRSQSRSSSIPSDDDWYNYTTSK